MCRTTSSEPQAAVCVALALPVLWWSCPQAPKTALALPVHLCALKPRRQHWQSKCHTVGVVRSNGRWVCVPLALPLLLGEKMGGGVN